MPLSITNLAGIAGSSANDTLNGSDANERLISNGGDDIINGGGGTDTVDFSSSENAVSLNLQTGTAVIEGARLRFAAEATDTAEIVVFDADSQQFFVAGGEFIDVLNADGDLILAIPVATEVTSVAVSNGLVAAAVPAADPTEPGTILIFEIDGLASDSTPLRTITVGALPDSIAFSPDGSLLIVANEGEADVIEADDGSFSLGAGGDPEGSISVIDVATGIVTTLDFTAFNDQRAALEADGVVFFGQPGVSDTTVAQDLEPEFVTFSADGTQAFVTIQENNAIAIVDLTGSAPVISAIRGLGSLDLSTVAIDANDNDGVPNQVLIPGGIALLQPDAVTGFVLNGQQFFATANEGDGRDFDVFDLDDTTLDPTAFPNAAELQDNDTGIGDFEVSQVLGDTDGDGDIDRIVGFGGRSFSIFDDEGNEVFNSGNLLTSTLIERFPNLFNDARSDDSGPEPESITSAVIDGDTFLFVGLELSASVLSFRLELASGTGTGGVPAEFSAVFEGIVAVPVPGGFPLEEDLDDLVAPEGLLVLTADQSPTGEALVVISDEEQGITFGFDLTLDSAGNSALTGIENAIGTAFDDTLIGNTDDNALDGRAGNDIIRTVGGDDRAFGGQGNDSIFGGTGEDSLEGEDGNDTIGGGDGDDTVDGGNGNDVIFGADGDDSLNGGAGNDVLFNGSGNDTVDGGNGNDTLWAGAGDDVLTGGADRDVFIFGANAGNDTVTDFTVGLDTLAFSNNTASFANFDAVLAASVETSQAGISGLLINLGGGDTAFLRGIASVS